MAIIRNISVSFGANTRGFVGDIYKATSALDAMARSSDAAQVAAGRVQGGGGALDRSFSEDASSAGSDMAAMAAGSFGPLMQIAARIDGMINRIGGTVVTLARRIDASMKFPATEVALNWLQSKISNTFLSGAIGAAKFGLKVNDAFGRMGDVAGKNLTSLMKTTNTAFSSMPAPINTAASAVKGLGIQIGLAFGVVGVVYTVTRAIKDFFVGGITGAMELEESLDKNKVVFGASADAIANQAETMGMAYGLPIGQIVKLSGDLGLLAKGAGQTSKQAATMSSNLIQASSDAMSLHNVPLDQALEKIRAGLTGESEPLRALGVFLTEAGVKAQAAKMGFQAVGGELSVGNKVMARNALILQGLAVAQGNLAQTQNSTTNQFRKAGGGIQNFSVAIGKILLPSVNMLIVAFNEVLYSIIETFQNNKGTVTAWAEGMKRGIEGVIAVIRLLPDYWKIAELSASQAVANIGAYLTVLPQNMAIIGEYIANNWVKMIADAFNYIQTVFFNFSDNIARFETALTSFFAGEGFNFKWQALSEGFTATMDALPELAKPALTDLSGEMGDIFAGIEAKKAAREAAMAPITSVTEAPSTAAEAVAKEEKYHGIAAATMGSTEAASSLAQFFNKSSNDGHIKATAANTADMAATLKEVAISVAPLRNGGGAVTDAMALANL